MRKRLLGGVALAVLAASPVLAADLPARTRVAPPAAPPVAYAYNWSGFYIGAHGGGGWSDKCFTFAGLDDGCHDGDGWLAGGQVGYNWQMGALVLGVEVSGSFADIGGSHRSLLDPTDRYHSRVDGIGLATGRLGYSWDRVLAYVTGGAAWVRDRFDFVDGGVGIASAKDDRWGWTVGAGLEVGLAPNWSVAAQYNYVDLGDRSTNFSGGGVVPFNANVDQQLHLATVRLNYRFGGTAPVVARY